MRFAVRLGFRQIIGAEEGGDRAPDRGAGTRQRLPLGRPARRDRGRCRAQPWSAWPRPTPSARSTSTGARRLWAVKGLDERRLMRDGGALDAPRAAARAASAATGSSGKSRGRSAGDGALRACGRGLRHDRALAEGASLRLLPRPCCAASARSTNIEHRSPALPINQPRHRRRPRADPPAPRHGQGRGVPDARGRDRHRQRHRLARRLRGEPARSP